MPHIQDASFVVSAIEDYSPARLRVRGFPASGFSIRKLAVT